MTTVTNVHQEHKRFCPPFVPIRSNLQAMPNNKIVPSISFTSVTGQVYTFTWSSDEEGQEFIEDLTTLTEIIPRTPEGMCSVLSGDNVHEYVIHHTKANLKTPSRLEGVTKVVNIQNKSCGQLCTVQMRGNRYRSFYWHDLLAVYQLPVVSSLANAMSRINIANI